MTKAAARKIGVEDTVFEMFPTFIRAVVIAKVRKNDAENPVLLEMLTGAARRQLDIDLDNNLRIRAWDDVHRQFGSNPNKYPPSIKALVKRARTGKPVPFINAVVAIFNIVSLNHLLPCGGDDIEKTTGDLMLGISDGFQVFVPLGEAAKSERVEKGEIVYFDTGTRQVMCRRWNWRNGDLTKVTGATRSVALNVDCMAAVDGDEVTLAVKEMAGLLKDHCGAEVRVDVLSRDRRVVELDLSAECLSG
jgi:lysyl-tRNA synthetase class 2